MYCPQITYTEFMSLILEKDYFITVGRLRSIQVQLQRYQSTLSVCYAPILEQNCAPMSNMDSTKFIDPCWIYLLHWSLLDTSMVWLWFYCFRFELYSSYSTLGMGIGIISTFCKSHTRWYRWKTGNLKWKTNQKSTA